MWEKTCLVCDPLSTTVTFTTEACQKTLQIKKGPLNCHSKKVLCLLKCKVCGEVPCIRKQKTNFATVSAIVKVNIEQLEEVTKKFLRSVFTLIIVMVVTMELMIGIL